MRRQVLTNLTPSRSAIEELLTPSSLVTLYGSDVPYCSSHTKFLATFSSCMTNETVSQFSVDCQDAAVASSAAPSVVPTATPSSSDSGLSSGAKAGIGVGAAVGGLLVIGLLVGLVVRNKKKKRKRLELESAVEADSKAPPYSSELPPNEKKGAPTELPPQTALNIHPVEVPGDQHWRRPQELEGDTVVGSAVGDEIETHPRQGEQVNPGVVHLRQQPG